MVEYVNWVVVSVVFSCVEQRARIEDDIVRYRLPILLYDFVLRGSVRELLESSRILSSCVWFNRSLELAFIYVAIWAVRSNPVRCQCIASLRPSPYDLHTRSSLASLLGIIPKKSFGAFCLFTCTLVASQLNLRMESAQKGHLIPWALL